MVLPWDHTRRVRWDEHDVVRRSTPPANDPNFVIRTDAHQKAAVQFTCEFENTGRIGNVEDQNAIVRGDPGSVDQSLPSRTRSPAEAASTLSASSAVNSAVLEW